MVIQGTMGMTNLIMECGHENSVPYERFRALHQTPGGSFSWTVV